MFGKALARNCQKDSQEAILGLSYKDAGVDIEAGNRLVDALKPLAAATSRPGTMARS